MVAAATGIQQAAPQPATHGSEVTMVFHKRDLDGSGVKSRFPSHFCVEVVFADPSAVPAPSTGDSRRAKKLEALAEKYKREAKGEYDMCQALLALPPSARDGTICWFPPEVAATVPTIAGQESTDIKVACARSQAHAASMKAVEKVVAEADAPIGAVKCGWLIKQGHSVRNWKRRWFVLRESVLEYYASPKDAVPRGKIALKDVVAVVPDVAADAEHPHCFEAVVYPADAAESRSYLMYAADEALRLEWVECVELQRMLQRDKIAKAVCSHKHNTALCRAQAKTSKQTQTGTRKDEKSPVQEQQQGAEPLIVTAALNITHRRAQTQTNPHTHTHKRAHA